MVLSSPAGRLSRHAVAVLLGLLALAAATAHADDWPGFLGLSRQSRAATGPLHWSATQGVRWRTPLLGEGHSSPIVVGDAVYLSYAEQKPEPEHFLTTVRVALLVLVWSLLAAALWALAARCQAPLTAGGMARLALMVALAATMALLVLYGENALDFDRALERGWVAAVLSLVLALALVVSAGSGDATTPTPARVSRWPLLAALGLVLLSGLAFFAIPDRAHAFDGGPMHPKSLFLLGVVVLPLFLGLMMLAALLRRRRPGLALTLATPGALLLTTGAVALVLAVMRAQANTRGTVSVSQPYTPHLRWWLPVALLAATALLLVLRRRWPQSLVANALSVLAIVGLALTGLGFGLEHLIARTPYLVYIIGNPYYAPIMGPWVSLALTGATILALAGALVAVKYGHRASSFRGVPALLAVLLGAGGFAYVMYVPRDQVFARGIIALDRDTGAIRWRTIGLHGPRGIMHSDNSAATPTPVSDGKGAYAYFGSPGVMAVGRAGQLLWTYSQLPFISTEGVATSPTAWRDLVIVLSESQAGQWLVALDAANGRVCWKTPRRHKMHMYAGNCRTPFLWPVRGKETIIVWGLEDVSGYDPTTGAELWSHDVSGFGESTNPVACPVADERRLYLTGPTQTVALDLDRLGRAGSPVAWLTPCTDGAQCASPVLANGLLFNVSDTGTAYCVEARTGRALWTHDFAWQHYASPIALGDRVYFTDTAGRTHVVAAEPSFRLLATNALGESAFASLAPVGGRLYVRTTQSLYCLQETAHGPN